MAETFTLAHALEVTADSRRGTYGVLLQHGTLELGFYKPQGSDPQQPHDQDEVYIVQSGSGYFVHGQTRTPFTAGASLFVAAGETHRFEDFSEDFSAWVIFYGPKGGEEASPA